jgi:hypothetical protein
VQLLRSPCIGSVARLMFAIASACAALLVGASGASAGAAACSAIPQNDPCLHLTPGVATLGTHVSISGQLTRQQSEWRQLLTQKPTYIALNRSFGASAGDPTGCEFQGGVRAPVIHVTASGRVTGGFIVDALGQCERTGGQHALTSGAYWLDVGCQNCIVGNLMVQRGELARTGASFRPQLVLASSTFTVGLLMLSIGRRRRRPSRPSV